MTTHRFILIICPFIMIALAIALTLLMIPDLLTASADHSRPRVGVERIEEDDPRWDCATMGNRICGPLS